MRFSRYDVLCRRLNGEHGVFRAWSRNAKHFDRRHKSGDGEIRTLDPLLARQVLSQLSYTPRCNGHYEIIINDGLKWTRTTDLTLIRRAL